MAVLVHPERVTNEVLAKAFAPPPPVDFARWAARNIVFSKRESDFPGPYNPDLFPFFDEILKALGPDDPCRAVTFIKSAQLGGTVLANVFTLGAMDMDPGDFLYVHPTDDNGRRWSKMKLKPMLRNTACLAEQFPDKARDSGDSVMYKERVDGQGSILISGANSPSSLSMITVSRQVQDDLAKWETNSAGDPEKQADSRSRGVEFAKLFKNSTPLVMPGCRITTNFEKGSQEKYHVPCPHCGHFQTLEWENFLSNLDEDVPEKTCFSCTECGGLMEEHHRAGMVRQGKWVAENEAVRRLHRSFYLWSVYPPLQSWGRIAREWLDVKGSPAAEQVFFNDSVGRAYRAKSEAPPWEALRDRGVDSDTRRGTIPAGHPLVTMGIDCQGNRVECQIVAWGPDWRRAVIEYIVIAGHISEKSCQTALTELVKAEHRNAAGRLVGIDLTAIDGNAYTEDVWDWAKKHPAQKVVMVRGSNTDTAPLLARVKKERNKDGKLLKYSRRFYNFNASILKMALYRNLGKTDPVERGYITFPVGLEDDYFIQLTAERRVEKKGRDGFPVYRWAKDSGQANEALDTMIQAEVAAIKLGVRTMTEAIWVRYLERELPPDDAQLDLEDLPPIAKSRGKPAGKSGDTSLEPNSAKLTAGTSPMAQLAKLNG